MARSEFCEWKSWQLTVCNKFPISQNFIIIHVEKISKADDDFIWNIFKTNSRQKSFVSGKYSTSTNFFSIFLQREGEKVPVADEVKFAKSL